MSFLFFLFLLLLFFANQLYDMALQPYIYTNHGENIMEKEVVTTFLNWTVLAFVAIKSSSGGLCNKTRFCWITTFGTDRIWDYVDLICWW